MIKHLTTFVIIAHWNPVLKTLWLQYDLLLKTQKTVDMNLAYIQNRICSTLRHFSVDTEACVKAEIVQGNFYSLLTVVLLLLDCHFPPFYWQLFIHFWRHFLWGRFLFPFQDRVFLSSVKFKSLFVERDTPGFFLLNGLYKAI